MNAGIGHLRADANPMKSPLMETTNHFENEAGRTQCSERLLFEVGLRRIDWFPTVTRREIKKLLRIEVFANDSRGPISKGCQEQLWVSGMAQTVERTINNYAKVLRPRPLARSVVVDLDDDNRIRRPVSDLLHRNAHWSCLPKHRLRRRDQK